MAQQFNNNARALLVSSINSSVTSIVIESAKADLFPVANVGTGSLPSASSWFKATLQDSSGAVEIVAVRTRTAGSGVLSNVIRGYDGTTALAFVAGTVVGLRITAVDVQTALDFPGQNNTFTGNNTFSGTNAFSAGLTGNVTGNLTGNVTGNVTGNLTGNVTGNASTANNITNSGGWNVTPSGTTLFFNYNGTNVAKLDSSGNLTVKANVTAFGTV
jgi:hypothetical protein